MMLKIIILITPQVETAHHIADEWSSAGAPGVTFIESYGLRRMKEAKSRVEILPGMMSMLEILRNREESSIIVFSVVPSTIVEQLVSIAQIELGDLNEPEAGVIFLLDVERAVGMRHVNGN